MGGNNSGVRALAFARSAKVRSGRGPGLELELRYGLTFPSRA